MLKLGDITLDVPVFQAPLSGYSDYAMRKLAVCFSAPLTFAGVMLAKSAANPRVLAKPIFKPGCDEHPIGAQILGNDPETMAKAAKGLIEVGYDLIDLNFACPVSKVLRRRRGGYLLKEPDTVSQILKRVRDAVDCPVAVKLRIGFDGKDESRDKFWQIASRCVDDGADALVVHGRTVLQRFTGAADWKILAELKNRFPKATIIASGDMFCAASIAELLQNTALDGVIIARGAIGNPWLFRELRAVLEGKAEPEPPSLSEQAEVMLKHLELVCELYKAEKAVRYFRKFVVGYCKRHPQRKQAQQSLLAAENKTQLLAAIGQWYQSD